MSQKNPFLILSHYLKQEYSSWCILMIWIGYFIIIFHQLFKSSKSQKAQKSALTYYSSWSLLESSKFYVSKGDSFKQNKIHSKKLEASQKQCF